MLLYDDAPIGIPPKSHRTQREITLRIPRNNGSIFFYPDDCRGRGEHGGVLPYLAIEFIRCPNHLGHQSKVTIWNYDLSPTRFNR